MPITKKFFAREILILFGIIIISLLYVGAISLFEIRYENQLKNAGIAESVFLEDEIKNFQEWNPLNDLDAKFNRGWIVIYSLICVATIARYIFYLVLWSIKTLRS